MHHPITEKNNQTRINTGLMLQHACFETVQCSSPLYSRQEKCSLNQLKYALDSQLRTIPDEPQLPHYTICRRAQTNSLIDMKTIMNSEGCVKLYSVRETTARRDCHNTVA